MPDKKIIAVMGATGAQGGGLARAIAADPNGLFIARAITRKTDSDKALALARLGVEVVVGDADDPPSLERAERDFSLVMDLASLCRRAHYLQGV